MAHKLSLVVFVVFLEFLVICDLALSSVGKCRVEIYVILTFSSVWLIIHVVDTFVLFLFNRLVGSVFDLLWIVSFLLSLLPIRLILCIRSLLFLLFFFFVVIRIFRIIFSVSTCVRNIFLLLILLQRILRLYLISFLLVAFSSLLLLFVNLSGCLLLLITPAWLLLVFGNVVRHAWLLLIALLLVVIFLVILLLSLAVMLKWNFGDCPLVLFGRSLLLKCIFLIVRILLVLLVLLWSCLIASALACIK